MGYNRRRMNLSFIFAQRRQMLESKFKTKLIQELRDLFPGCIVIHSDPTDIQGIPDLIILYNDKWAALEGKRFATADLQPNQEYYIRLMNQMSFASFIFPENKEEVLNALQSAFRFSRPTRLPRR